MTTRYSLRKHREVPAPDHECKVCRTYFDRLHALEKDADILEIDDDEANNAAVAYTEAVWPRVWLEPRIRE